MKKDDQKEEFITDVRIHLILYFFNGSRPKSVDYLFLKELSQWCNIIPLIGKVEYII